MTRPFEPDPVPPACEPTVERLQRVLDGELSADALDTDPPPAPESAPDARPIRINDEIAKAGGALRDSSRTITEPAASGPKVFASFTNALTKLPVTPVVADLEPARRSLAEIPVAAKTGLE